MPAFSDRSMNKLTSCARPLQSLFLEVVTFWDCTIIEGHRDKEKQNLAVARGSSTLVWPNGQHNKLPSQAVDVAPWPLDWQDTQAFYAFGGFVLGVAYEMEIPIRWGYDWDGDHDFHDQRLMDGVHFELLEQKSEIRA